MANFNSAITDDTGRVPCGLHLTKPTWNKINDFCKAHKIDFSQFLETSACILYTSLTLRPESEDARFILEALTGKKATKREINL